MCEGGVRRAYKTEDTAPAHIISIIIQYNIYIQRVVDHPFPVSTISDAAAATTEGLKDERREKIHTKRYVPAIIL